MGKVEKSAAFFVGIFLILCLIASYFPERRLWGINHLSYFSPILSWIIILGALLILIPQINSQLAKASTKLYRSFKDKTRRINIQWKDLFFVSVSFVIFWLFKTKTHFLGDGYLRAREIGSGLKFKPTEPLDYYLHSLAYKLTHNLWGWDAHTTYAFISCLAGAVFVYSLLLLGRLLSENKTERLFIFIGLITMGTTQLFFGYVESYTLSYLGVFLYITFSISYLKGKSPLFIPTLFLLLSFGLHFSSLYFLPSLAYLYMAGLKKEEKHITSKKILHYFIIGLVVLLVSFYMYPRFVLQKGEGTLGSFFLPLFGASGQAYTLFSVSHIIDFLNEQLLLSPVGLVIWGILISVFVQQMNFKHPLEIFLGVIGLTSFAFAFILDPKLGYAKDWDLFASTGLGYTLLGICFLLKLLKGFKNWSYLIMILVFTALATTLPFVGVNSSVDKSIARFNNLLDLYPQKNAYGHENLAIYYREQGDNEKEIDELRKSIAVEKTSRRLNQLAAALCETGLYEEGIKYFRAGIQQDPNYYVLYRNLAIAYVRMGKNKEAAEELELYLKHNPRAKDFWSIRSLIDDLKNR